MDPKLLDGLKKIPVFAQIEPHHLRELARLARPQVCRAHEIIVRQGDEGNAVYAVCAGFLKVFVTSPAGSLSTLCMMGPGEIFGELSLLDGGPRSASVTSLTRTELVVLERVPFLQLLEARPSVSIAIMKVLAQRVRRLSERTDDLVATPVGTRLAKQLLNLAEHHAHRLGPTRVRLGMKLSQRELGELVGATRESINKHLSVLRDEGVVAEDGGYVVITNLDVLRTMAAH
jgi:CRP/FNR family cyclic AMP-dependent transcriptional regulator